MNKSFKLFLAIFTISVFILPSSISATELKSSENLYIPQGETIDGNLYATSNSIIVDGDIAGDLIAFAKNITINGRLNGDLIVIAQNITVNGEINGNIRAISNTAILNGLVARNVNFIGNSLSIGKDAQINWDLLTGALKTDITGIIKGNVNGNSNTVWLSGKIGKNFNFSNSNQIRKIDISPEANINGNFYYSENTSVSIAQNANIAGKTEIIKKEIDKQNQTSRKIWSFIYMIFAILVIGLVVVSLSKKNIPKLNTIIKEETSKAFTWGFLASLLTPLAVIILVFSIIGIPLAFIIIVLWIILFYLAKIVFALFVGKYLINIFNKENNKDLFHSLGDNNLILPLVIGVIILWLLFAIPYIGWILSFIASSLGLGAILLFFKKINY
ncbi:polymer-forming cytoskeletal protein [Patescibacteria group bacterium]|nr:polymer-forming cytoskeletal protein [Patescibacteria group bacterium]